MTKEKGLTRDIIIQTLVNALRPLDYIHAFYEGGAIAFNRVDEWSDIDLYLVVDDKKVDEAFLAVEKTLKSLSPIKQKYAVPQLPWPGVSQAFYKLENASEYLIIDLAVLKLSSPEKFYFNKSDKMTYSPFDKEIMVRKLHERLERLQTRFDMFNSFVQKEVNRGNYLEAIDLYYGLILSPLVEALRIKYNPIHHDFRMRYVHYELPSEITEKLEQFYFVLDKEDLQEKYHEAIKWFQEIISEFKKDGRTKLIHALANS